MLAIPDTWPIDLPPLGSDLHMPYTLTPGRAAGMVLAEMGQRRIVGSRFTATGRVVVPAQDFDPLTGDDASEFVEAPSTGVLTAFTEVAGELLGLIRLDGSDEDFPHRLVDARYEDLSVGARVEAVWADEGTPTILAIRGFKLAPDAPVGEVKPLAEPAEAVAVVPYALDLHYEHAYGPYYGRLFDQMRTDAKVMGVRTSDGTGALVPPRELDDISHKRTGTWVEAGPNGTVRACSVIYLEFLGQTRPPPYVYAEIVLDGALTKMIHTVEVPDISRVREVVKPGTRVRAVWREERQGKLSDISHFELLDEQP